MSDGHRDTWGAPTTGWPTFDADGRRISDEGDEGAEPTIHDCQNADECWC